MSRLDQMREHTELVRRAAKGRWDIILGQLLPEIGEALKSPGRHVTCPFHGGKKDFRVAKDVAQVGSCICTCGHWDGFELLRHARRWTFPEAVLEVEAVLGGSIGRMISVPMPPPTPPKPRQTVQEAEAIQAKILKYWGEAMPLDAPEASYARRYLASRGLGEVNEVCDWRFHPLLPFYNDAEEGSKRFSGYPALVGVVRMADGRVATLHRTWLHEVDGRIKVFERKNYTALETNPVMGGAIRLCEANGPVLCVGEGIETVLSAHVIAPEYPVWSCVNKELLRAVRLPDHVRVVTVFADRDRSYGGQEAAVDLVDRLREEGRRAMVFLPPSPIPDDAKGVDWNDFLQAHGTAAARNHFSIQRWKRELAEAVAQINPTERQLSNC